MPTLPDAQLAQEQRRVRFFTANFHLLKGWCYIPAAGLLLTATLGLGLWQPAWASVHLFGMIATAASVGLTAPWMWWMNRRYRNHYGHVQSSDAQNGGLIGIWGDRSVPAWQFIVLFVLLMWWIVLLIHYLPEHTAIRDNHFVFFFVAFPLLRGVLRPPSRETRRVYLAAFALLVGATLLPLTGGDPWLVQTVCYSTLAGVTLGLGLYNHRLLVSALGPLPGGEEADDV